VDLDSQHIWYSDAPQAVDTGHIACQPGIGNHTELTDADLGPVLNGAAAVVTAHWPNMTGSQARRAHPERDGGPPHHAGAVNPVISTMLGG
jgi:hypothetical protein